MLSFIEPHFIRDDGIKTGLSLGRSSVVSSSRRFVILRYVSLLAVVEADNFYSAILFRGLVILR